MDRRERLRLGIAGLAGRLVHGGLDGLHLRGRHGVAHLGNLWGFLGDGFGHGLGGTTVGVGQNARFLSDRQRDWLLVKGCAFVVDLLFRSHEQFGVKGEGYGLMMAHMAQMVAVGWVPTELVVTTSIRQASELLNVRFWIDVLVIAKA